jgi:hypothetical protein
VNNDALASWLLARVFCLQTGKAFKNIPCHSERSEESYKK